MANPAADDGLPLELHSQNLDFVESLYADYVRNPESAPADWRNLFGQLANGQRGNGAVHQTPKPQFERKPAPSPEPAAAKRELPTIPFSGKVNAAKLADRQERVDQL